jgi:hypothetical protein
VKKISKLGVLIFIVLISITTSVYAASSCKIDLKTTKNEVSKDEEFVVDVAVSDIQSDRGIIALGANLEYDKNNLTLVKMEGENGWSTPSYNESNGKLVTERNGLTTSDETIFKITFKVKDTTSTENAITLNNLSVADGNQETSLKSSNITIKTAAKITSDTNNTQQNTTTTNTNTTDKTTQNTATQNTTTTDTNSTSKSNQIAITTTTTNTTSTNNTITVTNAVSNSSDTTAKNGNLPFTGNRGKVAVIVIAILAINCIIIRKKMKL